jgi:pantoate--beta-alanine ligase
MKLVTSIEAMRQVSRRALEEKHTLGLVPTMGALHQGHLSLVKACRSASELTVVSLFVNPAQFGPGEDFEEYPRDLEADRALLLREGVDILFSPGVDAMYPEGDSTIVQMPGISDILCGAFRPDHFNGVAKVVTKLFSIVRPDMAFFGAKDWQQAVLIRRLNVDLILGVEIRVCPTVRDPDGLAKSSRNRYLTDAQRQVAPELYRILQDTRDKAMDAGSTPGDLETTASRCLKEAGFDVQYFEIRNASNLKSLDKLKGKVLVSAAAFLGKTRLIDNIVFTMP